MSERGRIAADRAPDRGCGRRARRAAVMLALLGGACVLSCARTDEPHPIADASILDADSELDASDLDAETDEHD